MFTLKKRNIPQSMWRRGREIVKKRSVAILGINHGDYLVEAMVFGSSVYYTTISQNMLIPDSCTCPYFQSNKRYCKHLPAVIEELKMQGKPLEQLFSRSGSDDAQEVF